MQVITTKKELGDALDASRSQGKTIGLVPTMGALHQGHASLVRRSVKENDVTVVSDFVNPTQFNDKNDLANYPRTLDADRQLLESLGADIVFAPSVEEMYPEPDTRHFSYPPTDTVMEGKYRPGHFNGVCQIVSKLFYAVRPTRAYFGEKDFQQIAVIRRMAKISGFDSLEIVACPIVREADGLALSSRNVRLTPENRAVAPNIHRILDESRSYARNHTVDETIKWVTESINAFGPLQVEYYAIVHPLTMQAIDKWPADNDPERPTGCVTVYCGDVRLIDNIQY